MNGMVASAMPRVLRIDPNHPEKATIAEAARLILQGQVVGMPTETVYGLAADATQAEAVAAIYAAKGRPAHNPLIVHVADAAMAQAWASEWPAAAQALSSLWPGPLTMVLPARPGLAPAALAGGCTVGLRVPAHPVARALIAAVGRPLAAPSANPSNQLSPTLAQHVAEHLAGRIPLLLDAGPCQVGLESTVVDPMAQPPTILRPGLLGPDELAQVWPGPWPLASPSALGLASEGQSLPSPGMMSRHYAPKAPLHQAASPKEALALRPALPHALALISVGDWEGKVPEGCQVWSLPKTAKAFGAQLYASLHEADAWGAGASLVVGVPATDPAWEAVRDRLRRAQSPDERLP